MSRYIHIIGWTMFIIFTIIELRLGNTDTAGDFLILAYICNTLIKIDELRGD